MNVLDQMGIMTTKYDMKEDTCHNAVMKHYIAISEHMLYLFREVKGGRGRGCTDVHKSKKAESLELKILSFL